MDLTTAKKLSLEWVKEPDGVSLFFDRRTWNLFKLAANAREESAEHMITRAVVEAFGTILEDNIRQVLNRIMRAPDADAGAKPTGGD